MPQLDGIENLLVANLAPSCWPAAMMFVLAWLIERLVLRHLVNQEGVTLLMATLGITYFIDGLGQTIFGSDIYKIDIGMPKEPIMAFEACSRAASWSTRKTSMRRDRRGLVAC
jgi:branched-chain amino acid transport system permease protein